MKKKKIFAGASPRVAPTASAAALSCRSPPATELRRTAYVFRISRQASVERPARCGEYSMESPLVAAQQISTATA